MLNFFQLKPMHSQLQLLFLLLLVLVLLLLLLLSFFNHHFFRQQACLSWENLSFLIPIFQVFLLFKSDFCPVTVGKDIVTTRDHRRALLAPGFQLLALALRMEPMVMLRCFEGISPHITTTMAWPL